MNKKIIGILFCLIIILSMTINGVAAFKISNIQKTNQKPVTKIYDDSIITLVEVSGDERTYEISVKIKNTGDKISTIYFDSIPFGLYYIYNSEDRCVCINPNMFTSNLIRIRFLLPGKTLEVYNDVWKGRSDLGIKLPSGSYYITGEVNAFSSLGFINNSEPVGIYLSKPDSIDNDYKSLNFLSNFPIIQKILSKYK